MGQELKKPGERSHDYRSYHRTQMQKNMIIQNLKERGCRITKQRLMLLNIILDEDCTCCKEIYYKALKIDRGIGTATVYRMINTLEEIGAIRRNNIYKIACDAECDEQDACTIEFDDDTICHLSAKNWRAVIQAGLEACNYMKGQNVRSVTVRKCLCQD